MTRRKDVSCSIAAVAALLALLFAAEARAQDDAKWQAALQAAADARKGGQIEEVEKHLRAALKEAEEFGPSDYRLVASLNALGTFLYGKGDYAAAVPVFTRQMEIREKALGANHPLVAAVLDDIAVIESLQSKPTEAEAHGERALKIAEQAAVGITGVTAVAAGNNHTCALAGEGEIYCWGSNLNGQLGVPSTLAAAYPVALSSPERAVALAAGDAFTCALLATHNVLCWGANGSGQTGAAPGPSTGPVQVPGVGQARAIAAGAEHACALIADGTVKCWGNNRHGQFGGGTPASTAGPVAVPGFQGAKTLAAGRNHACAVTADGGVLCWGAFQTEVAALKAPIRVAGIAAPVTALTAGSTNACGLLTGGKVSCWWGSKPTGETTPTSPFTAPEEIKGLPPAQAVAAGYAHTCALLTDGTVRCWGNNQEGQLGDGQKVNSATPVNVVGVQQAIWVATGLAHSCAILADKTARCWGSDSYDAPSGATYSLRSATPIPAGRDESLLLNSISILAGIYGNGGKFDKADPLYQRLLQLLEKARGTEDKSLVPVLNRYAELLRKAGRAEEGAKIEARTTSIQFKPVLTDVPTAPPPAQ